MIIYYERINIQRYMHIFVIVNGRNKYHDKSHRNKYYDLSF